MAQNKLHRAAEFRSILSGYTPDPQRLSEIDNSGLPPVFLVGISGSGRNTIIDNLVSERNYRATVSYTTRAKRMNNGQMEQNGREYWFIDEEAMLAKLKNQEMLEAAIIHRMQVSGIDLGELKTSVLSHEHSITEIQPDGAERVNQYLPHAKIIFVTPPDPEAWLERLHKRGEVQLTEKLERYRSALDEVQHALDNEYYQLVINQDLGEAIDMVDQIAGSDSHHRPQSTIKVLSGFLGFIQKEVQRLEVEIDGSEAL